VESCEKDAQEYWNKYVAALKNPAPSNNPKSLMIVASVQLCRAVILLLAPAGVTVEQTTPVRTLPGQEPLQFAALTVVHNGAPVLVPIVPCAAELQLFVPAEGHAVGSLIVTVSIPDRQSDTKMGWVPASAISQQILGLLTRAGPIGRRRWSLTTEGG
jgi:hypothetical protein